MDCARQSASSAPLVTPMPTCGRATRILGGHLVAKHHLAARQHEPVAGAEPLARRGGNRAFLDDAAPGDVAGVGGLEPGKELAAHGGAETVGADQEIAARFRAV